MEAVSAEVVSTDIESTVASANIVANVVVAESTGVVSTDIESTVTAANVMVQAVSAEVASIFANIVNLKSGLSDMIEPDFGLLDYLLRLEVLTHRQLAVVRSRPTVYERNDAVLDLLVSEDQCNRFLFALQQTGQQHIFNLIKANGGQKINLSVTCPTIIVVGINFESA